MDYTQIRRFSSFNENEKEDYQNKVYVLYSYLKENVGQKLVWSLVNNTLKLPHLYTFSLNQMNESLEPFNVTIKFDDDGIWAENS